MTNDELDPDTLIEMEVFLEPHYARLSSLLGILDIVRVEYEGGLYDGIYSSANSIKSAMKPFDSSENKDFWFTRNCSASIAHLSRAISHMKEVIVNSVPSENSELFEKYVSDHRDIVEIAKSYISSLGSELEKDLSSKLGLKKGPKIAPEDFMITMPKNKLKHNLESIFLDLDETRDKFSNLANVFLDAFKSYQDFFESNKKNGKTKYDFDVTHVESIRGSISAVREVYDTTIKPSELHHQNPDYPKFIAHLENACNCLEASVSLLHLHERYLQDPRKDGEGRNVADIVGPEGIYDIASKLTFQDAYTLLNEGMVYAVGIDKLQFDSIDPVVKLMKLWGDDQDLVQVYWRQDELNPWEKMEISNAERYDLFDKTGKLDPSRYYGKVAVVLHGVLYDEYNSDKGIPVVKDISELKGI